MDAVTERQKAFRLYHDALGTPEKPSEEEFDEAFKGVFSSFEEFVEENLIIEDLTGDWPTEAKTYFDRKKFIDELALYYLVVEAEEEAYGVAYSVVYVFSEN